MIYILNSSGPKKKFETYDGFGNDGQRECSVLLEH